VHENAELIERFYKAFAARDAEGMVACYAADVAFDDPVFPGLRGGEARAMWRMLTKQAKSIEITHVVHDADAERGSAHWEAKYPFSKTGRQVHNVIEASFRFRDGKIVEHKDSFDLWRWSRMALGPVGLLLGWSPIVRGSIRKQARAGLEKFMQDPAATR
jgi:ketosteroid isomerase-like protein